MIFKVTGSYAWRSTPKLTYLKSSVLLYHCIFGLQLVHNSINSCFLARFHKFWNSIPLFHTNTRILILNQIPFPFRYFDRQQITFPPSKQLKYFNTSPSTTRTVVIAFWFAASTLTPSMKICNYESFDLLAVMN